MLIIYRGSRLPDCIISNAHALVYNTSYEHREYNVP